MRGQGLAIVFGQFEEGVCAIHHNAAMRVRLHVRRQTIHIDAENAAPEVLVDALGVVVAVVEAAGVKEK